MTPICYYDVKMGDFNCIKTWRSFIGNWVRFVVEKKNVFWSAQCSRREQACSR